MVRYLTSTTAAQFWLQYNNEGRQNDSIKLEPRLYSTEKTSQAQCQWWLITLSLTIGASAKTNYIKPGLWYHVCVCTCMYVILTCVCVYVCVYVWHLAIQFVYVPILLMCEMSILLTPALWTLYYAWMNVHLKLPHTCTQLVVLLYLWKIWEGYGKVIYNLLTCSMCGCFLVTTIPWARQHGELNLLLIVPNPRQVMQLQTASK